MHASSKISNAGSNLPLTNSLNTYLKYRPLLSDVVIICRIIGMYYLFSSAEDRTPRPGEEFPSWPKPQPNQPMVS